jgi:signal transduction histidine kinase/DNA-binding response OmpR family regulator
MKTEPRTILVVEDDAAHAEAIRRAFIASDPKIEIVQVATLREYRARVAQQPPDIAIMDLNLPDGRAVEVMTSPPENGAFPILLMTSYGNEVVAVEAIKSGAIDYIVKSTEAFSHMPRTVERALREWRLLAERKQAERDIRESEARFHTLSNQFNVLLDTLPDRIVLYDLDLRVIWANRAATNALAPGMVKPGETHCYTFWNHKTPCDPCPAIESLQSGEPAVEITTAADGKVWEKRSIPVKESGRLVSMIEICRDISEHHKLEEQFRQAQKMESVGRLAGGVAHDYNNMLSVILGYAEIALENIEPGSSLQGYLQAISDAAQRSAGITRQLLAFARQQAIAPQVLDLNDTVESMLKMLRRLIGEDITLTWLPAPNLWPVMIDPTQVDQLLANLCVNARDAITGVGTITIETGTTTLDSLYCAHHTGMHPGEYVLLAISDNGCGMEKELLENIFEPFFTTKGLGHGTGLGLATAYGIVKQNNGFIDVTSEPGKGTTFKIFLPRHMVQLASVAEEDTRAIQRGQGETVLVVEDEAVILELIRIILVTLGYKVLATNSPAQAVSLAREQPAGIQLLLSDVVMPEMNGRDLAELIQALHPGLKCLFMSGYTANIVTSQGVLDSGIHFIQKPFSRNDLAAKVRAVLDAA